PRLAMESARTAAGRSRRQSVPRSQKARGRDRAAAATTTTQATTPRGTARLRSLPRPIPATAAPKTAPSARASARGRATIGDRYPQATSPDSPTRSAITRCNIYTMRAQPAIPQGRKCGSPGDHAPERQRCRPTAFLKPIEQGNRGRRERRIIDHESLRPAAPLIAHHAQAIRVRYQGYNVAQRDFQCDRFRQKTEIPVRQYEVADSIEREGLAAIVGCLRVPR